MLADLSTMKRRMADSRDVFDDLGRIDGERMKTSPWQQRVGLRK